ncbi:ABC transporter permease subunit [Allobacillus salarius]|uniref:ABC transporter permease subunit n=2 Tax=Bacillaceae TaxID=186817 RepID=A0A556PGM3_9BACI|nr:ABC transporter permease subunit [Allobacillus salarius]
MMNLLKFEIKKIWRQKKIFWLLLILILFMSFQYYQNTLHQDSFIDRLYESTEPLKANVTEIERELDEKRVNNQLNELEKQQSVYIKDMKAALQHWRSAIYSEELHNLPQLEHEFLKSLQNYLNKDGEFEALTGLNLEYVILKNTWMIDHNLSIEDEDYPISPHLFMLETGDLLFGVLGIILLLLIFGNILSIEREQQTWFTLKTQPIKKSSIILSKYFTLISMLFLYVVVVVFIGMLLPIILNDHHLLLNYPQIIFSENKIRIISSLTYFLFKSLLFFGAGIISFSLLLLISMVFKKSFSSLIATFFVLLIGHYLTTITDFSAPMNLFHHYQLGDIIIENRDIWYYPLFAVLWAILIVLITLYIPERQADLLNAQYQKSVFNSGDTNSKRGALINTVIFELRKLFRKGYFLQVISILFLLIVIGYFFLNQEADKIETEYFKQLNDEAVAIQEEMIPMYEKKLFEYEDRYEKTNDKSEREYIKKYIDGTTQVINLYKERVEKIEKGVKEYELGNWEAFHELQLFTIKLVNGDFDESLHYIEHNFDHQFQYEVSVEEKEWSIKNNIQPIFPGEFRPTVHDDWGDNPQGEINRDAWEERNHKVNSSGLYTLYHFYEYYLYLIPLGLFLFLLGGGYAAERGKKNTIHFLQTQPISKTTIFLGKILSSSLIFIVSYIGLMVLLLFLGTITDRFGDWNFPILHYDSLSSTSSVGYTGTITDYENYGFHFTPLGNYLLKCIGLLFMLTILVITLSGFISTFIKNTFAVMVFTVLVLVSGHFISIEYLSKWAFLSPFIYLDLFKVSNGTMATLLDQSLINTTMGIVTLFVSSCLLVYFSCIILKRD